MKKIICVTLALLMLLCTACYPTGEEMVNSIEEIDLFEMNKSDNENITFDFNESPKYEKSYPCFTAKFVEKEKFQEQASQIFLEDQNINDYTIQDNLTSNWNDKENTFTLYKFNLYKDIFNDYNGAFALDNGYIYFDRGGIRKGYETSKSAIDDYKTPENVRKHYADDKTNAVDLETVKTESEDILKSLGFDITSEPEIYVINKKALESISIFKKDQLEIFKEYRKQLLEQLDDCIFKSQKNKVKMEIEEIDEKISNQYTKIKEEVSMLNKLKTAIINGENKVELVSDDIFSYYDLLTFLKNGIIFKKVNVHNFEKDVTYIYDNEGNYVLENKDDESLQFAMYLSENSNDNTKFERNITVIEE